MQYRSQPQRTWWFPAVAIALVVALSWAPVVAAGVSAADSQSPAEARAFTPRVSDSDAVEKVALTSGKAQVVTLTSSLPKRYAPLPRPKPVEPAASGDRSSSAGSAVASARTRVARSVRTQPAAPEPQSQKNTPVAPAAPEPKDNDEGSGGDESAQAKSILASLIAQHPILAGTTVSFGSTPGGYQAVAYFKSGRILVSPNHRASLRTILRHEVWHIIDWRDNNHIDWGENIPPK